MKIPGTSQGDAAPSNGSSHGIFLPEDTATAKKRDRQLVALSLFTTAQDFTADLTNKDRPWGGAIW
jgi:hypothetical protein